LNCKICKSTNINNINLYGYEYSVCSDCSALYLNNVPEKKEVEHYYEKEYLIEQKDILQIEKRRIFRISENIQLISIISKYATAPAKILDIGCDKGYFLDEARRYDYDVNGLELSDESIKYCINTGINVKKNIDDYEYNFDIITMWHSLEHFPDPNEFLKKLKNKMEKGAYIFIRVPNYDNIWRKIFGKNWTWLQPENHYFQYNQQSLRKLLELNGFDIEYISSRKPNNRITKRMFCISNSIFKKYYGVNSSLRQYIGRKYQDITGVEIFAIAKLKA
jgi:2-polyprenyl-3-methyl-5-hydroxy-6-metoxy-1,4-benzoquinol methylase